MAGLALLGPVEEKFVEVTDIMEPLSSGQQDGAFISKGYDATSHFETEMDDVLQMYTRITGKQLDLEVLTLEGPNSACVSLTSAKPSDLLPDRRLVGFGTNPIWILL